LLIPAWYGVNVNAVMKILVASLREAAATHSNVLPPESFESEIVIDSFGHTRIVFAVYVTLKNLDHEVKTLSYVRDIIMKNIRREYLDFNALRLTVSLGDRLDAKEIAIDALPSPLVSNPSTGPVKITASEGPVEINPEASPVEINPSTGPVKIIASEGPLEAKSPRGEET
jgi:hypothetical protein